MIEVRLASSVAEIHAAQALRYRVFYQEMGAEPSPEMTRLQRDFDQFDDVADHLIVINHARGPGPQAVIGTYRLIRRSAATRAGRFYSAAEYDIATMVAYPGEILELGRSCVDVSGRNLPTMQLLWRGVAAYVFHYEIALMFGCASLPGTDPDTLEVPLSYLYYHHLAPPALRPRALQERYVDMRRLPASAIDPSKSLEELPPLIKGYLRLGGYVGDGAVIDRQFNTIDVFIVVKTDLITDRYYRNYERQSASSATVTAAGKNEAEQLSHKVATAPVPISSQSAELVLRGIQASEIIARQQIEHDPRWQNFVSELPAIDLSTETLRALIFRRIRRMFRSLSSYAREDGIESRRLSFENRWAIDVQYEILDRLPSRPDETNDLLRSLLTDLTDGVKRGERIVGAWGEIGLDNGKDLILLIPPVSNDANPSPARSKTAQFIRIPKK